MYKPTTGSFNTLPEGPDDGGIFTTSLAFDPEKSPYYYVVRIQFVVYTCKPWQFVVYSSETNSWTDLGVQAILEDGGGVPDYHFCKGVYCNGAVHWFSTKGPSYNYIVDQKKVLLMPYMPDAVENICYFGESNGHLHLVDTVNTRCDVYELARDYAGWFLRFSVDLGQVYPKAKMVSGGLLSLQEYHILFIYRGQKEDQSFLMLYTNTYIIQYNLLDRSFKKIQDWVPRRNQYQRFHAFPFYESLSHV